VSERAWAAIEANPAAPRDSALSLLDWRERWIAGGRRELPQIPHHLETRALDAALARIEEEGGIERTILRHRRSRAAARAGIRAAGLAPWVAEEEMAAAIATLVACPSGLTTDALLAAALEAVPEAPLSLAPAALATQALRINHTGEDARLGPVLDAVAALALGLRALGGAGDEAAAATALDAWWAAEHGAPPAVAAATA